MPLWLLRTDASSQSQSTYPCARLFFRLAAPLFALAWLEPKKRAIASDRLNMLFQGLGSFLCPLNPFTDNLMSSFTALSTILRLSSTGFLAGLAERCSLVLYAPWLSPKTQALFSIYEITQASQEIEQNGINPVPAQRPPLCRR